MKNTKRFLVIAVMVILVVAVCSTMFMSCSKDTDYTVGVCQLVQHPALDSATQGFVDALKEEIEAAGKTITIDVQNASGESTNCATIVNKFVSSSYDLIMANATPALTAAAQATKKIPVLGTSITDYATALNIDSSAWTGTVGGNISGTSDLAPIDKQAQMVLDLIPTATKVGILYCSSEPNSLYQANKFETEIKAKKSTITVEKYTFSDSNDLGAVLDRIAAAGLSALYIPTDNVCASNTGIINQKATAASLPIVAGEESIAKGCGVATLSISYYDLGKATGKMAADILLGKANVSEMEIQYASATTYEYIASRCTALGITVPSDYVAIEETAA